MCVKFAAMWMKGSISRWFFNCQRDGFLLNSLYFSKNILAVHIFLVEFLIFTLDNTCFEQK